jgi:drug/metabolite transporter (DMT)-like permease
LRVAPEKFRWFKMIGGAPHRASTAYVLLILTVLFWAGNWVIARGMQGYMSPIAMAFWRWLAALVILLPFVVRPIATEWPAIRRSWKILTLLAAIGVAAFNTFTYTGLKYTEATNAVLLNSIIPILIIAIGVIFLRERVNIRQIGGVLISLVGVAAIVARGDPDTLIHLRLNPAWAIYTVCLRWRPRELSSRAFTGTLTAIGMLMLIPLFAWDYAAGNRTQWGMESVAAVAYFGIFPSVLAYFFWNAAVARVGAQRAGAFLHLMPLFGAALSWAFLGESLLWYHYAGAALIFLGLFVAAAVSGVRASRLNGVHGVRAP